MSRFALPLIAVVVIVGTAVYYDYDRSRPLVDATRLNERYGGPGGNGFPLDGKTVQARSGVPHVFTPAVCAPPTTPLTNVELTLCVPWGLSPGAAVGWGVEGHQDCARYRATFLLPVERGTCGNPEFPVIFQPSSLDRYPINYAIRSDETREVSGSFVVEVTR